MTDLITTAVSSCNWKKKQTWIKNVQVCIVVEDECQSSDENLIVKCPTGIQCLINDFHVIVMIYIVTVLFVNKLLKTNIYVLSFYLVGLQFCQLKTKYY